MTLVDGSFSGSIAGKEIRPSKTYPEGRRCTEQGCGALLSIYNPATSCANHPEGTVRHKIRIRGVKYR